MSLARAFTTRRAKVFGGGDGEGRPFRSHSVKTSASGPIRSKISAPVELIHTTNMLSYNAPDLHKEPQTAASSKSSSSLRSDADSEQNQTAASTPPTSPDSAFTRGDKEADKSAGLEPNHLSCYFTLPGQSSTQASPDVPSIPKRAPSHSKKSYEALGRKPSVSRLSESSSRTFSKVSATFSRASSASTSTTASSHHSFGPDKMAKTSAMSPRPVPPTAMSTSSAAHLHKEPTSATEKSNPFGHELAQVTELAEEYASSAAAKNSAVVSREEQDLIDRGLHKFNPQDYINEIQGLFATFLGDKPHGRNLAPQWI